MPYSKEEVKHTAFVNRLVSQYKADYDNNIEKILTSHFNYKKDMDDLAKPAVINEPPKDKNDRYILFQNSDNVTFDNSIDFEHGVCNFIIQVPHKRKLATPHLVTEGLDITFKQVNEIITEEDANREAVNKDKAEAKRTDKTQARIKQLQDTGVPVSAASLADQFGGQ
jgi:hypothetical protein